MSEPAFKLKPPAPAWLAKQPAKSAYFLSLIGGALVRAPYWLAASAIPAARQRQSWSFKRAMFAHACTYFVPAMFKTQTYPIEMTDPAIVESDKHLVWVEGTPQFVVGEIQEAAAVNGVEPSRVVGRVIFQEGDTRNKDERARSGEKLIYYFHGGGYCMGDINSDCHQAIFCRDWMKADATISRAFLLEYRLAQAEPLPLKNNFPTALIDAVAGYNYLVNVLGFEPRNIILSGESVGAHIAINLIRYLLQQSFPSLPPPGSLIITSPTSDWGGSHVGGEFWVKNANTDFVQEFYYGYPTRCQLGSLPREWAYLSPWISPASLNLPETKGLFKGFPPTFLITGGAECTLDAMRTLRDRMQDDLGNEKFEYLEVPDAMHAFVLLPWYTPENVETLTKMVEWEKRVHSPA